MNPAAANPPIGVDGVSNFRSTEGYPARGGVVRAGRLFHSGSLQAITDAGQRVVADLGIRTLIDLRTDSERTGWPDRLWPGVRVEASPVLGDTQTSADIVIAIALLAVGVDRDTVVADYVASSLEDDDRRAAVELMTGMLEDLDRIHGGAAGLLTAGGFGEEDLERLHRTLVEG